MTIELYPEKATMAEALGFQVQEIRGVGGTFYTMQITYDVSVEPLGAIE